MSTATITLRPSPRSAAGLRGAVGSEWTKLWTVRSTWYNVVGAVALTGLLGLQYGFSAAYDAEHTPPGEIPEPTAVGGMAISVLLIVQVVVAAFAMLPVTSEYATGSIRSTLQWTPVRRNVVLAKAIVLAPVLFGYGVLLGAVAALCGGLAAGQWAAWPVGGLIRDLAATGAYATLAGLFTAGIAFVVRNTAGTLTVAFLLLLILPLMLTESSVRPLVWIGALLPGGAGQGFLSGADDPLHPTASLLVLIAWAALGLLVGTRVLRRRDA